MIYYIAEIDEARKIAAVWVKEQTTRRLSVFDPNKHVFDPNRSTGYFGAPKEKIMKWLADNQQQARLLR